MILKLIKNISNTRFSTDPLLFLPKNESFLFETLPSFFYSRFKKKPSSIHEWIEPYVKIKSTTHTDLPVITWLGHSTFLIQIGGLNIITDPVFDNIPLFTRILPCPIPIDSLPPIDIVLLSHNHPDHMDMKSLYTIVNRNKSAHFYVPRGDAKWFTPGIFPHVHEFQWSESAYITTIDLQEIECIFLPAAHWSRRSIFDQNKSLWGSWLIRVNDHTIFFAGDTAYNSHFSSIAQHYTIDVALLPIGPVEPRELMKISHIGPEQAGQAFLDLQAKHFIPMHWGTFSFGKDIFDEPITLLKEWWKINAIQLTDKKVTYAKVGQQISTQEALQTTQEGIVTDISPNNTNIQNTL